MRTVRIWFEKKGVLRFVSHLDTMRCMTRAVRRAGIPLWYTEGFNPHPYLNFPAPMPLGVAGLREPMDIRIEGDMTDGEIVERLNAQLPPQMKTVGITQPVNKPAALKYAKYLIELESQTGLADKIKEALSSGSLTCEKPGKVNGRKSVKTVDISAGLKAYDVRENDNIIIIDVTLPCSNESNINPINLMTAIKTYLSEEILPVSMTRYALLIEDMSDFI